MMFFGKYLLNIEKKIIILPQPRNLGAIDFYRTCFQLDMQLPLGVTRLLYTAGVFIMNEFLNGNGKNGLLHYFHN